VDRWPVQRLPACSRRARRGPETCWCRSVPEEMHSRSHGAVASVLVDQGETLSGLDPFRAHAARSGYSHTCSPGWHAAVRASIELNGFPRTERPGLVTRHALSVRCVSVVMPGDANTGGTRLWQSGPSAVLLYTTTVGRCSSLHHTCRRRPVVCSTKHERRRATGSDPRQVGPRVLLPRAKGPRTSAPEERSLRSGANRSRCAGRSRAPAGSSCTSIG